jgi:hypothetical protein
MSKKQPAKNTCRHCATELRATFVHRMTQAGMTSQPGFECPRCLALYDMRRNELSAPLTNRGDV